MHIVRDGLSAYRANSDALLGGRWTYSSTAWGVDNMSPVEKGKSFYYTLPNYLNGYYLRREIGANRTTLFVAAWVWWDTTITSGESTETGFQFWDGSTAQLFLGVSGDGSWIIRRGDFNGTQIGKWTGAFLTQQWNSFVFQVVIDPAAGEVHGRVNGSDADDFQLTSVNTSASGNAYATAVGLNGSGETVSSKGNPRLSSLWFWDNVGAAPNSWMKLVTCRPSRGLADTAQKQFTQINTQPTSFGYTTQTSTNTQAVAAGTLQLYPYTPLCGGEITQLNFQLNTALAGHVKLAIYDSDGTLNFSQGGPGTLLAQSNEVANPGTGLQTVALISPVNLMNGHKYWIGVLSDAAPVLLGNNSTSGWQVASTPYASGLPSTVQGLGAANGIGMVIYQGLTTTNSGMVNDDAQDGVYTYLQDANAGDYDLYEMEDVPINSQILGVSYLALVAKSDVGPRGYATTISSGSTLIDASTYTLNTSFNWVETIQDTDPNTGLAWTAAGWNASYAGPKVKV